MDYVENNAYPGSVLPWSIQYLSISIITFNNGAFEFLQAWSKPGWIHEIIFVIRYGANCKINQLIFWIGAS